MAVLGDDPDYHVATAARATLNKRHSWADFAPRLSRVMLPRLTIPRRGRSVALTPTESDPRLSTCFHQRSSLTPVKLVRTWCGHHEHARPPAPDPVTVARQDSWLPLLHPNTLTPHLYNSYSSRRPFLLRWPKLQSGDWNYRRRRA